jgi:hypothetical protein
VVVWRESPADSTDDFEIYFRTYDFSDGDVEELLEPTLVGSGTDASVAMDGDGNFLIAWLQEGDILGQRFTDQGAAIGSPVVLVDSEPNLFNSETNLDVSISGSQAVVGYERYRDGYPHYESFVQQFHFVGNSVVPGVQRSLGATANGLYLNQGTSVAMNESGQFVVAYVRDSDKSVRVRKFHPDGSSMWPVYEAADAELIPPSYWSTVPTVRIDVGNVQAINPMPLVRPSDDLDTTEREQSPIPSDMSIDLAPVDTETLAVRGTDSTLESARRDLNDQALLATINEGDGLLTDITGDLEESGVLQNRSQQR